MSLSISKTDSELLLKLPRKENVVSGKNSVKYLDKNIKQDHLLKVKENIEYEDFSFNKYAQLCFKLIKNENDRIFSKLNIAYKNNTEEEYACKQKKKVTELDRKNYSQFKCDHLKIERNEIKKIHDKKRLKKVCTIKTLEGDNKFNCICNVIKYVNTSTSYKTLKRFEKHNKNYENDFEKKKSSIYLNNPDLLFSSGSFLSQSKNIPQYTSLTSTLDNKAFSNVLNKSVSQRNESIVQTSDVSVKNNLPLISSILKSLLSLSKKRSYKNAVDNENTLINRMKRELSENIPRVLTNISHVDNITSPIPSESIFHNSTQMPKHNINVSDSSMFIQNDTYVMENQNTPFFDYFFSLNEFNATHFFRVTQPVFRVICVFPAILFVALLIWFFVSNLRSQIRRRKTKSMRAKIKELNEMSELKVEIPQLEKEEPIEENQDFTMDSENTVVDKSEAPRAAISIVIHKKVRKDK